MPRGRPPDSHIQAELDRVEQLRKRMATKKTIPFQQFVRRIAALKDAARRKLIELDTIKTAITKEVLPVRITFPLNNGKKALNRLRKKKRKTRKDEENVTYLEARIPQLEKLVKEHTQGKQQHKKAKDMELAEIEKEHDKLTALKARLIAIDNAVRAEQERRASTRWV